MGKPGDVLLTGPGLDGLGRDVAVVEDPGPCPLEDVLPQDTASAPTNSTRIPVIAWRTRNAGGIIATPQPLPTATWLSANYDADADPLVVDSFCTQLAGEGNCGLPGTGRGQLTRPAAALEQTHPGGAKRCMLPV